jgi:hypothetical protein
MYSCNSTYDVNVKFGKQLTHNVVYICVDVYIYVFGVMWIGLCIRMATLMYKVFPYESNDPISCFMMIYIVNM